MDDLALAEIFEGLADVGVVDKADKIIVGNSRLLLSREVLVKIGDEPSLIFLLIKTEKDEMSSFFCFFLDRVY